MSMTNTKNTNTKNVEQRNSVLSQDLRVLCSFCDQGSARPYETALMDCGVSLLRARHGMHAYWLAIASKPAMAIVDARQTNLDDDFFLSHVASNNGLAKMPVLVMTDNELPVALNEQFTAIPSNILPSDLAPRVRDLLVELTRVKQQNVDDCFSVWDETTATEYDGFATGPFAPSNVSPSFIRTDAAGESLSSRTSRPEPVRRSASRMGR